MHCRDKYDSIGRSKGLSVTLNCWKREKEEMILWINGKYLFPTWC
ncbi:MAG: hypothetical protein ACTS6H_01955 [Candidatus Hodgkinia cicadicola]